MTQPMNRVALVFCLSFGVSACTQEKFGPVSSPASEHPAYAAEYPKKLESTHKRFQIERSFTKDFDAEFKKFPEELENPDWEQVARIYMLAEQDGKSAHYAEVRRKNGDVAQFFVEENKEISRKISGGVHYQAEQEKCDAKFYGTIDRGLENGVKERFQKREDSGSEAAQYIAQNETELGKNAPILRTQARALSAGAQLVYVDLAVRHGELSSMVEEASEVKKTIDRRLQELSAVAEEKPTSEEAKAREQERESLTQAKQSLDAIVKAAEKTVEASEQDVIDARAAFEEALDHLRAEIKKRRTSAKGDGAE